MRAGIALGSNLGDRLASLRAGRDFLLRIHEGDSPALTSPLYETSPVDCPPGSPRFLNAVIEIETSRQPHDLLRALQEFETQLGRPATHGKNSPRVLDLDVLYFGDMTMATDTFNIPHPRLHLRRFVLQPLCEIRPQLVIAGQTRTVAELLALLPEQPDVSLAAAAW